MSTERILQVAIVAGVALTLFVLERFRPLRRLERPLVPRLLVNGAMSVFTYGTAFAVVQPVAMRTLQWTSEQSFGVLARVGGAPWSTWLLGFLLLDLSFYYWHRLNQTDSNYSVVFSVWDRLHRSFRWGVPQDEIRIGVPGYARPSDNSVGNLVRMAFRRQRDYWQGRERRSDR